MKPRTVIFLFPALLIFATIASAHAFLDHAEPKVGSDNATAPTEVKIWFTQEIESSFSRIKVLDDKGRQIDKKDSHIDSSDKKLMIVSVDHLAVGSYKVEWNVVSVDTHKTKGEFKFEVTK
jgi:hypothetical protein